MGRTVPRVRLGRHSDDREILALAVPALGALAADPLYSLVDTAFVGNLGTPQLGALAIGTAAFTASFWLFSFLAYGVTPRVARAFGAGDPGEASRVGVQALLLALSIGAVVFAIGTTFTEPFVGLLGGQGEVAGYAEPYLRIRMLSAIPVLVAQVGHGWLRGAQDTRTPMIVAAAGAIANIGLDYLLIYPAGLGVRGAAWATVIGQGGAAIAFLVILARRMRAPVWRFEAATARSLLVVGADLAVRTGALLVALTIATSVAARMGENTLATWQITMQVFLLLSLTVDSIAISAQALVARHLGARDPSRARLVGRRLMTWGFAVGLFFGVALAAGARPLAGVFSDDRVVVDSTAAMLVWLAAVQPVGAAAFTLDGILIGAIDTRFLAASMLVCSGLFIALLFVALDRGWGLAGLALGASAWLVARVATTGARFVRGAWAT